MTPTYTVGEAELYCGDALAVLKELPAGMVHCVVTSPPFWGLRDYGTATFEGGDPGCDHRLPDDSGLSGNEGNRNKTHPGRFAGPTCWKCGARRIDQQIGLEKSPDEYIAKLVEVFREVRRVMREDATLWLNMGDSYGRGTNDTRSFRRDKATCHPVGRETPIGLKAKDLCGIPWRLAFALQDDGWYWRQWFPWPKRSAMPGSQQDRATTALDVIHHLTVSERCFFDMQAVRHPAASATRERDKYSRILDEDGPQAVRHDHESVTDDDGRAWRNTDFWFESIHPPWGFVGIGDEIVGLDVTGGGTDLPHYATFPLGLPLSCIKAGTSERGCCAAMVNKLMVKENPPPEKADALRRFLKSKGQV